MRFDAGDAEREEDRKGETYDGADSPCQKANAFAKKLLLASLIFSCFGALPAFVSALVWSVSDEVEFVKLMLPSEANGYIAMFIIFGLGGAIAAAVGAVCQFIRLPHRMKHLDFALLIAGSLLMAGGLIAQCVFGKDYFATDFEALYSVWGLLGILSSAAALISGLMKFTSVLDAKI